MKLIAGGILTLLVLTGCSSESTTSPTTTQNGGGSERSTKGRDMCVVVPGPEAAKALGVASAKAEPDESGACWYSEMPECGQSVARDCAIIVEYNAASWKDASDMWEAVPGVGEKAYYFSTGILNVKVGANDTLVIKSDSKIAGGDVAKMKKQSVELAKAFLAKL